MTLTLTVPPTVASIVMVCVFLAWAGYWQLTLYRFRNFVCPQCGQKFFMKKYMVIPSFWIFRHECVNCGAMEP